MPVLLCRKGRDERTLLGCGSSLCLVSYVMSATFAQVTLPPPKSDLLGSYPSTPRGPASDLITVQFLPTPPLPLCFLRLSIFGYDTR